MNNENNKNIFHYLEEMRLSSKNKLINLGILINSGGIVGILSITKAKPLGDLNQALLFFIMSVCTIFLVELITNKITNDSLYQIIAKDRLKEEITLDEVRFYKIWVRRLLQSLNFSAFALGFYAIKLCIDYLNKLAINEQLMLDLLCL